jgi:hypothetical protein
MEGLITDGVQLAHDLSASLNERLVEQAKALARDRHASRH